MARNLPFVRPAWLPQDIVIPAGLATYEQVSRYCTGTYYDTRVAIGLKLDLRIDRVTVTRSRLQRSDILSGNVRALHAIGVGAAAGGGAVVAGLGGGGAAVVGAEKGAELGLLGGPIGVAAGAVVGGAIGFLFYCGVKKATEETYETQVDMYTRAPAMTIGDPSPLNLLDEVRRRNIEIAGVVQPIHALGEDARRWYYLARLGRYCWIQRGQRRDPGNHQLAAESAHEIANACHMNLGAFQWP